MNNCISKSVTPVTKITRIRNNRKNGKKYEGELVKILKENMISARLGRSNEEGDIILPEQNIIIEAKSTKQDRYKMSLAVDQYKRLTLLPQEVWYAVRFKRKGVNGWEFYPIPCSIQLLYRHEGLTLREFVFKMRARMSQERKTLTSSDKILISDEGIETIALKTQNRDGRLK